jgi:hypothetical protein
VVTPSRLRTHGGIVRLIVTGVERQAVADADRPEPVALHGTNGQRRWRLTLPEALLAARTGRYVFEVEHAGERRRAELLGECGHERLYVPGAERGNLLDVLPDVFAAAGS